MPKKTPRKKQSKRPRAKAGSPRRVKKPRSTRSARSTRKPAAAGKSPPKRKRYNSLGQHEVVYSAWIAEGTIAGAVRRLRAIEGFESIDERTVRSIHAEKKGTADDWDERAKRFHRELSDRVDSQVVEEVARLKAATQKKLLRGLEKLAAVAEDGIPDAARKILGDLKGRKISNQDRIYGFAKVLREIVAALRPPERGPGSVNIDNRKLTLAVTSPREIAQRETRKTLEADVTRRERSVDLARV